MLKNSFLLITAFLALAYIISVALLYFSQNRLIFPAEPLPQNHQFKFDAPFTEINFPVEGAIINALHFKQKDPKGLIFFLHGNAGNLVDWVTDLEFYQRANYDLFIFDYRGYGKSTGKLVDQAEAIKDTQTAWDLIAPQYSNKPIVIYGRSIGSALATQLAQNVKPELLVLVSPFNSLIDMAKTKYPFVPTWLVRFPFETNKAIKNVSSPVVLIHGDKDDFITIEHSKRLQKLTQKPSQLITISGAGHSDIHQFDEYVKALTNALP